MPLTDTNDLAKQLRDTEFAAVADLAYLDHASDSPAPERTRRVIVERAELLANPLAQVRKREDYLADANRLLADRLNTIPGSLCLSDQCRRHNRCNRQWDRLAFGR